MTRGFDELKDAESKVRETGNQGTRSDWDNVVSGFELECASERNKDYSSTNES